MDNTLYALQVGDEVVVTTYYSEYVEKVERLTNNYVIVRNAKYRKSDGFLAGGDSWSTTHIRMATPADIEQIKNKQLHNRLVRAVNEISFQSLTNNQLQSILQIAKQSDG